MSVGPPLGNWRRVLIRPHYLDDVLLSALLGSPEIIFWRNYALFFSFAQITVAVLSFPLFFVDDMSHDAQYGVGYLCENLVDLEKY